jgi:hypothetical protein
VREQGKPWVFSGFVSRTAQPINFAHHFKWLCLIGPKAYQRGQDEAFARDQVGLLLGCIDAAVIIPSNNPEADAEEGE